jgi:anti-sigma B factor antagonist
MDIPVEERDGVAVAEIPVDELDASNSGELKRAMAPILDRYSKLVVDMSRLRFVDSSGLGAMLSCLRHLSAKGGDLKLCGMSKSVRAAFELVRMHRIFDILATCEDAAKAFMTEESARSET